MYFKNYLSVKISRTTIFVQLRRYLTFCHVYLQCVYTFSILSLLPFIQAVLELGSCSRVDSPLLHRRKRTFGVSPEEAETRNEEGWRVASWGWLNKEQK